MEKKASIDIDALNAFLESVKSYTEEMIYGAPVGEFLYHYSDLNGLQGILQNHDLWLTHSRYSNDEEEMTYGYNLVNKTIKNHPLVNTLNQEFLNKLTELLQQPSPEGVYICCFCISSDLLSQWRGYGANGTGVCIGFDPKRFDFITGPDSPNAGLMRIWKVFYDPSTQENIVVNAILHGHNSPDPSFEIKAQKAADAIQFFIPTFKNFGFQEENECRMIFTPYPHFDKKPKLRVSRGLLIPYYSLKDLYGKEIEPEKFPVTSVQIGPNPNKNLNVESANFLLQQTGYPSITAVSSLTPYRGY